MRNIDELRERYQKGEDFNYLFFWGHRQKDEKLWYERSFDIVVDGNRAKFSQNRELKKFLLSTSNRVIVEASPYDKIWGIGMSADDKRATNPTKWRGENRLGFALMVVRELLKKI